MCDPEDPGATGCRDGAILLVVLVLLALFAAVGLSVVLYTDTAATSARLVREAELQNRHEVEPEFLLAYFLGQLLYDVDDQTGVSSALRGHSLARDMYGWNSDTPESNITPFNGTGRLHTGPGMPHQPHAGDYAYNNPFHIDDYWLINYTYFAGDGFLRDPERLGPGLVSGAAGASWRTDASQPHGPFTGGFNPPYTYPDLDHVFLAAVKADGTVLLPSFHRPWAGFGSLAPTNPYWRDRNHSYLKYLVLRPRPADMGRGFPAPEDAGGDVKNLVGGPGGNDSIWLDLNFPVLQASDGRKYKPLFAPLIVDLDNRVNVNVHGNVRGASATPHVSNQGWGPWEVNLGRVLPQGNGEWTQLLLGTGSRALAGRYGPDGKPAAIGKEARPGPKPHSYAQVDFDGSNEGPGGQPTGPLQLPGFGGPPFRCFPIFPPGYGNGSGTERREHPLLYNLFQPAADDRGFAASNLDALLRYGDTGSPALTSELFRLCPVSFTDPRIRRLVTTHSFDVDRPGVIPWLFDRSASAYQPPLDRPNQPPTGPPVAFPALTERKTRVPESSDFRTPGAEPGSPLADWRSTDAALGRVDVNCFLPPYPHQGQGLDLATYAPEPMVGYADQFDPVLPKVRQQFLAAQAARQRLADDIYRRLLVVTGVPTARNPAEPKDEELRPRRWLAQLAANIVDFLDEDDISTPFNFYTAEDAGDPAFDSGGVSKQNPELLRYWVVGTELPRVVLNEVLIEYQLPSTLQQKTFPVKVWVELFNPLPKGPFPAAVQPGDVQPVPLYVAPAGNQPGFGPYQIVLANTNPHPGGPLRGRRANNDNILGTPDIVRRQTGDGDFGGGMVATVGGGRTPFSIAPQSYFLVGPGPDARHTLAPPPLGAVPPETPWLQSSSLQYQVMRSGSRTWLPDDRSHGLTVLLRRLANPHLPLDPRPTANGLGNPFYNPYVTLDYLEGVPLHNAAGPERYHSIGKLQPYASDRSQLAGQRANSLTQHTLGAPNNPLPDHYDWLVHLDRQLISPMELLHVSGYHPHELLHEFISTSGGKFHHRVPWFDPSNRLYRLFEFLETGDRASGVVPAGRIPGKINLNTVWDPETFLAVCDPQPANRYTDADVMAMFWRMIRTRTPGLLAGGGQGLADRPFLSLAVGHTPRAEGVPLFPKGSGINDTVLRAATADGDPGAERLFQLPNAVHPYVQYELLTKIFNQLTTRSNVFAVWLTVGFFDVTDDSTRPVKLGAEIGRAENRQIRHRMFAVADRSQLTLSGDAAFVLHSRDAVAAHVPAVVAVPQLTGSSEGIPWKIQTGSRLVIDVGPKQEVIRVDRVKPAESPPTFQATFAKEHRAGFLITNMGNPGPQERFDPRHVPALVPYFSIIQ